VKESGAGAHALHDASRFMASAEKPTGLGVRARQRRFPPAHPVNIRRNPCVGDLPLAAPPPVVL